MLKWAEKYISLGWFLLPIIPKDKNPYIKWKHRRDKKPDMNEVHGWLKQWPNMNLGIATGKLSGVVVIDLDGIEGLKYGKSQHLTSSIVCSTGKGKHLYYKWETETHGSVSQIAPHVDIRADGDIIILPPSQHPNGKIYRWERFVPQNIETFTQKIIVPSVIEKAKAPSEGRSEGWIARSLEEMKIGNIDNTLTSILGRMRRDGYSEQDCHRLLEPHALGAGATKGHLEEKIRNIWSRYSPGPIASFGSVGANGSELQIHSPADDDSFKQFVTYRNASEIKGIETGFPTLDKYFRGGIESERLFTVAAITGTGKTNFGIALSQHLCLQDQKVLYFSTEFKYQKIWLWYIERLGTDEFRKHPFYVCDAYSPNIEQIEKAVMDHKPNIVIFDYIQHLGKEKEILTKFMHDFQFLQRKYKFQGIVLAQLNRTADAYENGKKVEPRMSMIEGAATIEQASSRVLLLDKVKENPEYNEIVGILAKNDNGETGRIVFGLYKNPYHFREII